MFTLAKLCFLYLKVSCTFTRPLDHFCWTIPYTSSFTFALMESNLAFPSPFEQQYFTFATCTAERAQVLSLHVATQKPPSLVLTSLQVFSFKCLESQYLPHTPGSLLFAKLRSRPLTQGPQPPPVQEQFRCEIGFSLKPSHIKHSLLKYSSSSRVYQLSFVSESTQASHCSSPLNSLSF